MTEKRLGDSGMFDRSEWSECKDKLFCKDRKLHIWGNETFKWFE